MQTPVELDFKDIDVPSQIRQAIDNHVARLVQRFGRVTTYRVAVKGPSEHRQKAGSYYVTVDELGDKRPQASAVTLPGEHGLRL